MGYLIAVTVVRSGKVSITYIVPCNLPHGNKIPSFASKQVTFNRTFIPDLLWTKPKTRSSPSALSTRDLGTRLALTLSFLLKFSLLVDDAARSAFTHDVTAVK